jgi:hypothetical protein
LVGVSLLFLFCKQNSTSKDKKASSQKSLFKDAGTKTGKKTGFWMGNSQQLQTLN